MTYFKVIEPRPFVLFEIARAALTKATPKVGAIRGDFQRLLQSRYREMDDILTSDYGESNGLPANFGG